MGPRVRDLGLGEGPVGRMFPYPLLAQDFLYDPEEIPLGCRVPIFPKNEAKSQRQRVPAAGT